MSITNYWCQAVILPKKVLRQVNIICRSFLWFGYVESKSLGNISWEKVCKPKKEGGLEIRDLETWNLAAVGKVARHISTLNESLWVKWIHEVYMKGGNWILFNPPITSSWVITKLCKVKDKLLRWMNTPTYSITKVYNDLGGGGNRVGWDHFVWNRLTTVRSRFIGLVGVQQPSENKISPKDCWGR